MKNKFFYLLAILLLLVTMATPHSSFATTTGKNKVIDKKEMQKVVLSHISQLSKGTEGVTWNSKKGIPSFVTGKISEHKVQNVQDALQVLTEVKDLFDMDSPQAEMNLLTSLSDPYGQMFKFQQTYRGVPVFANELILHANQNGITTSINGYYDPQVKIKGVNTNPKLSDSEAIQIAKADLGLSAIQNFDIEKAKLYVYESASDSYRLVYVVTLSTLEGNGPTYADVFVDAHNGAIVHKINKLETAAATGSGTGVLGDSKTLHTDSYSGGYYLRDLTKHMYSTNSGVIATYTTNNGTSLPGSLETDSDDVWTDHAAVDAHYYAGVVYDYYYNKFGRNSFDNSGATITSTVHYSTNYNNAFWNGSQMVYGDGDGTTFIPLSGGLDVDGHEMTHAVTERTAGLVYQDQSGALNESISDAFGNLIENKSDNQWLVGEDIYTPNTPGDALRSMSNPPAYGDPDNMANYVNTTSDNGGVHTNSGIPNKAFYNFVTSSGVTRDNAASVWYRALTQYLTSNSQFIDARNATVQAATDLYGSGSTVATACANAWTAVGVGGSTSSNDPYEPNDTMSAAYGSITSGTTYNGYIGSGTDVDWFYFNSSASGTISVSLTNLAGDYDLYLYNSAGTELARSWNSGTSNESISYSASSSGTFYVKVVGYNGAYSTTTAYALKATYPTSGSGGTAQWYYENISFDTPHPYPNNYDSGYSHTYSKPGATKVALHFSRFETESGYDFAYILDGNGNTINSYSGTQSAFWAIVDGSKITSEMISDYSVTYWGYHIDQAAYYSTSPLVNESNTTFSDPIVGK